MSDFLKTNWYERIRTDPVANAWDWEDMNGETHYLGEYIFLDRYIPANEPKVKQSITKPTLKPKTTKKKRKTKKSKNKK